MKEGNYVIYSVLHNSFLKSHDYQWAWGDLGEAMRFDSESSATENDAIRDRALKPIILKVVTIAYDRPL